MPLPSNDSRGIGEIGVLFAVPRREATDERPTLAELRDHVKARLADYKAPDVLVWLEAIPLTSLGKPDKRSLRERADHAAAHWRR